MDMPEYIKLQPPSGQSRESPLAAGIDHLSPRLKRLRRMRPLPDHQAHGLWLQRLTFFCEDPSSPNKTRRTKKEPLTWRQTAHHNQHSVNQAQGPAPAEAWHTYIAGCSPVTCG